MIQIFNKNAGDKHILVLEEPAWNSWIHVEEPTQEELEQLVEEHQLDPWLLQDATDVQEVPRVEVEGDTVYIFARFVHEGEESIETFPMLLILHESMLITVTTKPFPRLAKFREEKIEFTTHRRVELMMKLFKEINDTYNDYLNTISKKIRNKNIRIDKIRNKDIVQFVYFENILYDFNTSLVRIHALYALLGEGKIINLSDGEKAMMQDLVQESTQLIEISKENSQTIVNIRDAASTIMTNNLNRVIKLFTALTVVLTIPTIVGAFYGMNVKLPFAENPFVFQYIFLGTLVACIIVIGIFYYKDWL